MTRIHFSRTWATLSLTLTFSLLPVLTPMSQTIKVQANNPSTMQLLTQEHTLSSTGLFRSQLTDEEGKVYTDPEADSLQLSTLSAKKASALPDAYDSRDEGLVTSIKDQGTSGACWSFAAIKAIESFSIKKGLSSLDSCDYSENHLAWFSYHPTTSTSQGIYGDGLHSSSTNLATPYINGGSAPMATYTLANWIGTALETDAPFSAGSSSAMNSMATSTSTDDSLRFRSAVHLQNATSFDEYMVGNKYYYSNRSTLIPEMKQAILDAGALDLSFYYASNYASSGSSGTSYYQNLYAGHTNKDLNNAVMNANHCVTAIGWDDSYSRMNFPSSSRPSSDGAWLIANSYGDNYGENGCFWLSYEDASICDIYSFDVEANTNYEHNYQYDGFGWNDAIMDTNTLKTANVFTCNTSSPEKLSAVSFYTLTDQQQYQVQVYRNVSTTPSTGVLVSSCTTTGTIDINGYHTITLANPVNLAAGEHFAVVVSYISSNDSIVYAPIEGTSTSDGTLSINFSSLSGQSYFYDNGNWYDLHSKQLSPDGSMVSGCSNNTCIKAFTDSTQTADALPQSTPASASASAAPASSSTGDDSTLTEKQSKLTLGKGETYKPAVTSSSNLNCQSSKSSVAAVSSTGKITAKKKGTATITLKDNTSLTTINVTVKKAPKWIKTTPSKLKKVKKGKPCTLKTKLSSGSASHTITFVSSKKKVATISSKGKVTTKKKGTTILTVKTYNKKKVKLKLIVK